MNLCTGGQWMGLLPIFSVQQLMHPSSTVYLHLNPDAQLSKCRTACDIYDFLWQHYGSGDYNSVANLESKLCALSCGTGSGYVMVQDYIMVYQLYTNEMGSAGYPMPPHQLLQLFIDGLPNNAVFTNFCQSIYISLNELDDLVGSISGNPAFTRICQNILFT